MDLAVCVRFDVGCTIGPDSVCYTRCREALDCRDTRLDKLSLDIGTPVAEYGSAERYVFG
jgi:hypothetical protein